MLCCKLQQMIRLLPWLLLVSACAVPPDTRSGSPVESLDGTEWLLSSIRGEEAIAGSKITLEFKEGTGGGYSGCNWYGGSYRLDGTRLEFGDINATMRACTERELNEQEARFHQALRQVTRYRIERERLILSSASGETLLLFARTARDPS